MASSCFMPLPSEVYCHTKNTNWRIRRRMIYLKHTSEHAGTYPSCLLAEGGLQTKLGTRSVVGLDTWGPQIATLHKMHWPWMMYHCVLFHTEMFPYETVIAQHLKGLRGFTLIGGCVHTHIGTNYPFFNMQTCVRLRNYTHSSLRHAVLEWYAQYCIVW